MNRRDFLAATVAATGALLLPTVPTWAAESRWRSRRRAADWVLRGATVYDGTGRSPVEADVAIVGDRIEAVGPRLSIAGAHEVDLKGLALAPGFIDIHSHTDLVLLVDPKAQSKIRQGVTTEVAGQDGGSVGPWGDAQFEDTRDAYRSRYGVEIDFRDLAGFFARLRRQGAAVNLASMVGHGTLHAYVVGASGRPATEAERGRMAALVTEAVKAGACGVSSGLEYLPGAFADLDELAAVATPLKGTGLPYATHLRNEDDQSLAALEEALNVGRKSGAAVHISHLKAQGERNWWKAPLMLELSERARAGGLDVTYDCYPYVAYATGLSNMFPVWAREGGTDAFLARLQDPAQGERIKAQVWDKVNQLGTWDAVQISNTGSDSLAWARGKRLGQLAAERQQDPYALLLMLVEEDRNRSGMVGFGMSEEDVGRFLAHPLGMICSDGSALTTDGPLARGTPHPRNYGTFPRVLGLYCRDRKLMSLETAIHKMTGMPAARLKLAGRGTITPRAFADFVAFDPGRVADRATFEQPHQYPVGIPHVMVNGQWVIRDGEHTQAQPGRVLTP
ncbi:MAG: D-aminoacylase [Gemmatimonadetes bacterium]|nr:D-aminoacylase [Gemmatimonadota bacterium]